MISSGSHQHWHGRAVLAVGRQVLEIAYHLLKEPTTYRELGTDYFDRYSAERLKRCSLAQLQRPLLSGHSCPSPHRCLAIIFQDKDNSIDDCWRNPDSRENRSDPVH
jgi:hypothetical protein